MFIVAWGIEIQINPDKHREFRQKCPQIGFHIGRQPNTMLLTAAQKCYQAKMYPQEISGDFMPTIEEKTQIRKLINTDAQFYLYFYPVVCPPLRVITFNLGNNIQRNIMKGSESQQVEICQRQYPQHQGWSLPVTGTNFQILSACTNNAVNWLAQQFPDLIGLQEVVENYLPEMVKIINLQTRQTYKSILAGTTAVIYNPVIFGEGYLLTSPDLVIRESKRSVMLVWFPFPEILVINLHAPHNIDLEVNIKTVMDSIDLVVQPKRILMTGDFNDTSPMPLTFISLFGFECKQPGVAPISCCTDRNYQHRGDYIFDSKPGVKFYGVPTEVPKLLMSDHYPVLYDST